ncbi:hypothetical protein IFM89_014889 [Coptis chinensis]|uniref:Homeobox domain-containing protein n=1 Tax=Coptis chinensis TaxID=261450 RepID=A0A835LMM1_9MAGN|nr:hypothetical protein IFM89_014889 [Coptis chinensis]
MQMAVSSFESVVGLSSATPYTSLALKTVSRHFRTLKNAISDQLRNISKALGEDLLSPSSANSSKGDMDFSRFRCINQNLQKQKAGGNDSLSFLEPQQPIWRPQRGLPERAVTVLRAWLFEHFLHPYPTDTDKHMLASQTGLSRNQHLGSCETIWDHGVRSSLPYAFDVARLGVSNWFINARVRVWKPMVEEMHMLETNGSTEMELNSMRNNQKLDTDIVGNMNDCSSSRQKIDQMSDKQPRCSSANDVHSEDGMNLEEWSKEKRSRIECHTTGVDGGLMGFLPYHHSGLGAVSLTLGLRHSTDQQQQQQQQQQQREHQLSRHYGGHMIHDFVG